MPARARADGELCINGHVQSPETRLKSGRCNICYKEASFKHALKKGAVLPRDTPANLRPYKEPLTAVEHGYGYLGTLAQNEEKTHVQCHICGYFFANVGTHSKFIHGVSAKVYRDQFQLSASTSLASDAARVRLTAAQLRQSSVVKQARLENFRRMQRNHSSNNGGKRKSLEQKNREGRCFYQLLDKISALATKLEKVPTKREFSAEYGSGYLGSIYLTFGTWNDALTVANLQPRLPGGSVARFTRDSVIELFQEFYRIEGRPPRQSDCGKGIIPSQTVIRRLFGGSIIEARRASGMGEYDYVTEDGQTERELARTVE